MSGRTHLAFYDEASKNFGSPVCRRAAPFASKTTYRALVTCKWCLKSPAMDFEKSAGFPANDTLTSQSSESKPATD